MKAFLLLAWLNVVYLLLPCTGGVKPLNAQSLSHPPTANDGAAVREVRAGGDIQSAINGVGPGGRVVVGPGTYSLKTALHPLDGTVIDCAGGQIMGKAGAVFKTIGHIWALENPQPSHSGVNSVTIMNCVFDLSNNPDALGALNLRAIAFSKFYNTTIVLPPRGNMEGVLFDGQDAVSRIPAYWNDFYSPNIYALGRGGQDSHVAFLFINGGNDEHIFGGAVEGVSRAFVFNGSDGSMVAGTGAEQFSRCIDLAGKTTDGPNHVSGNTFLNVRCESRVPGNVAINISASSYNNQILFPHSFATTDISSHIRDLSNGQNIVAYSVKDDVVYTVSGLGNRVRFGINKEAANPGLDIHGDLSVDGRWNVQTGINGNSGGFKVLRGNTCDTSAQIGATCAQKLNWQTPFKDSSYTVTCTLAKAHGKPYIIAVNPDSVGLNINIGSGANAISGGLVHCVGIHD